MSTAHPAVRHLPPIDPESEPSGDGAGPDHPMRKVTREVAFAGGWSPERARKVAALFDSLAPDWHTRMSVERLRPLRDALDRGSLGHGRCVEIGSGTGIGTSVLAEHFDLVIGIDLSGTMLRLAPPEHGPRVQADAARLPVADGAADAVALVNALLFPSEVARILAPDGAVVWVNTSGDETPIHLSAEDVVAALPGSWAAVASQVGRGTWCVARRRES